MISDKVIKAYPFVDMLNRAKTLNFATEQVGDNFFMSLITPEGTFKVLQFKNVQQTDEAVVQFLGATTGIILEIMDGYEKKIQKILDE